MADTPYISEIKAFSFNFAPKNWAQCNGQTLPISQNQALFSLLGTTYGGNGQTTFQLPNLQGRVPMHFGTGMQLGQIGGESAHTIIVTEMPAHNHTINASNNNVDQTYPTNNLPAKNSTEAAFHTTANNVLSSTVIATAGGSQPHENKSPYLVLNFCIALVGIFPSRN